MIDIITLRVSELQELCHALVCDNHQHVVLFLHEADDTGPAFLSAIGYSKTPHGLRQTNYDIMPEEVPKSEFDICNFP